MTDRDEIRVDKALQGVEFPASKDTLVAYARERGAGERTLQALQDVPDGTYTNKEHIIEVIPQQP